MPLQRPSPTWKELRTVGEKTAAVSIGAATVTPADGVSAGVGVAVRSHIGLAVPPLVVGNGLSSRFLIRWVGTLAKGGFHLGSVYLRCSEGCSAANLDILQELASILKRVRGQWLVGGDFNMTPEMLQQSGWLALTGGVLHRPRSPTCNGKEYDYFVSSRGLAEAVAGVAV
eukprot:12162236-Karenia_brevis.AAC.1